MAQTDVHIAPDGLPTPDDVGTLAIGDSITFHADGADSVLCFPTDAIFGTGRLAIEQGTSASVTVQESAPAISFTYTISVGDLNATCGGHLGGEEEGFGAIGATGGGKPIPNT